MVGVDKKNANMGTKIFFAVFFMAMFMSIGLTYYHTIVRQDYAVFTDTDAVPNPADFFAYLVNTVTPYFQK